MPIRSQPLSAEISAKLEKQDDTENDRVIKSQRIGKMFDWADDHTERKVDLKTRLEWKWRDFKGLFHDIKHTILNHIKWHKTMKKIRPWEGFDGISQAQASRLEKNALKNMKKYIS